MKASTRVSLLAAAEAIVAEQGVNALSVRRIGEAAGINPTLVTYHFGSLYGLLDELCSLVGECVPRSSEIRYCMRKCDSNDDCRGDYECRDIALMIEHGGEPVLAPGVVVDESAPKFCAARLF